MSNDNDARIVNLEQDMVLVKTGLASLNTATSVIVDQVKSISVKIDGISDSKQTNWSTLAAWAGVIIVIMTAIGSLTMEPYKVEQKYIQRDLERLEKSHEPEVHQKHNLSP